jgi:aquaporin Z
MATKSANKSTKKSTTKTKSTTVKAATTESVTLDSVYKTLKKTPIVGVMVAEFLGAFLLTASFIEMQGNPLFVAFALAGVVLIVGGVSGAHVNPAVTIGSWVTRKINWLKALGYIAAQLLGAAVALLVLNTFLNANESSSTQLAASSSPSLFHAAKVASGKEWYVFFAELLGTSVLALGAAAALRAKGNKIVSAFTYSFATLAALYISMSLTTALLSESNVTLSFLNPAVALVSNGLSWSMWPIAIYILAPALGGVIGFALQDFLRSQDDGCDCDNCK